MEYSVVMENNGFSESKPYTVKLPTKSNTNLKNRPLSLPIDEEERTIRNPFVIPGIKKLHVDPQLNPDYSFANFGEGD